MTAPAGATGLALALGAGVLNITLLGASNIDVTGNGLANVITGNSGNNAFNGGDGADTLTGGAGNDVFIIASPAEHAAGETIDGGANSDAIRFTSTTAGQTLRLNGGVANIEEIEISDAAGLNTGTTPLNINASAVAGNYTLTGNDGNNILTAGNGANTVNGGAGAEAPISYSIGRCSSLPATWRTPRLVSWKAPTSAPMS